MAAASALPMSGACGQSPATDAVKRSEVMRATQAIRDEYPGVPVLSPAEVMAAMKAGNVVLVDIRSREEQGVSMLPGAVSRAEFEAAVEEEEHAAVVAGRTVVAYCTIGFRSSAWAEKMAERGVPVFNMEGSILAWTHAGGALVANGDPTRRVHVYERSWNLAATGYKTVWRPEPGGPGPR